MTRFRFLLVALLLPMSMLAALETWTDGAGRPMQAKLVEVKGEYVVFEDASGSRTLFPLARLSAADRERVIEQVGPLPATKPAAPPTPALATAAAPANRPLPTIAPIANALAGRLITTKGGAVAPHPPEALRNTKLFAIYFSAGWCGPCRNFTPELVKAYPQLKAARPDFELVFVSADRSEAAMRQYMSDYGMPWPALTYSQVRSDQTLASYRGNGIPNLVFIDGSGKVLSKSYDDSGEYLGPRKVLKDIRRHLQL